MAKKIFLFGHNRKNFYSFRDADHEPAGKKSLKEHMLDFLRRNGIDLAPFGRVMLLTLPRVFGYVFNPISIYYCFDAAGAPVCSVAEVGNTFREMKLFLLRREELEAGATFKKIVPKHFYVSPFSELDLSFDFKLKIPGDKLDIRIDDRDGEEKVLISTLYGPAGRIIQPQPLVVHGEISAGHTESDFPDSLARAAALAQARPVLSQDRKRRAATRSLAATLTPACEDKMNQSTATLNPAFIRSSESKAGGFYQRIVMQSLERMTLGCLQLELPDGTKKSSASPAQKFPPVSAF